MYYISHKHSDTAYDVTDTTDGVEEAHTVDSIMAYISRGIRIEGVTSRGIFVRKLVSSQTTVYSGEPDTTRESVLEKIYIASEELRDKKGRTRSTHIRITLSGDKYLSDYLSPGSTWFFKKDSLYEGNMRAVSCNNLSFSIKDMVSAEPWVVRLFCNAVKRAKVKVDNVCSQFRNVTSITTSDGVIYSYTQSNYNEVEKEISTELYTEVKILDCYLTTALTEDEWNIYGLYTAGSYYDYKIHASVDGNVPMKRYVTRSGIFYDVLERVNYKSRPAITKIALEKIIADPYKYYNCLLFNGVLKVVALDGIYYYNVEEVHNCFKKTISRIAVTENTKSEVLGVAKKISLLNNGELDTLDVDNTSFVVIPEGTKSIPRGAVNVRASSNSFEIIFPSTLRKVATGWFTNERSGVLDLNLNMTKLTYPVMKSIMATKASNIVIDDMKFTKESFSQLYSAYAFSKKMKRYQTNLFYGLGGFYPKYEVTSKELLEALIFIINVEMNKFEFLSLEEKAIELPSYRGNIELANNSTLKKERIKYEYFCIVADVIIDHLDSSEKYAIRNFLEEIRKQYDIKTVNFRQEIDSHYSGSYLMY